MTPQDAISFISKGWGGRVSEQFITEYGGILNNILSGDIILADRGFLIKETLAPFSCIRQQPDNTSTHIGCSRHRLATRRP